MQNQQVTARTVSQGTVLGNVPGFLGPAARDGIPAMPVEGLLDWVYGAQMAHAGGARDGVFTGYDAMGYSDSCLDERAGGGGLVPLRPKVHALAEDIHAELLDALGRQSLDRLIVHAGLRSRPDMGQDAVWFEPPGPDDVGPDGRRRPAIGYFGKVRWCRKRRRVVDGRRPAVCHVERRGPSPEVQKATRRAYREWREILVLAYDSLKTAGFAVLEPVAPVLPMEPWEGWEPRYARARDLVAYNRD